MISSKEKKRIIRLSRPELNDVFTKFPQRHVHISRELQAIGFEVQEYKVIPVHTPFKYISYLLGMVRAFFHFLRNPAGVVIAEDVECVLLSMILKSLRGTRFVFDFIDDYALVIKHQGRTLRYYAALFVERAAPRLADLVIVVDKKKLDYCLGLGLPEKKVVFIPNGYDGNLFKPRQKCRKLQARLNLNSDHAVTFIGKITKYYNLETVMSSVPIVLREMAGTTFLFVGDGYEKQSLQVFAEALGVGGHVLFTGIIPHEEIPKVINISDVCICPLPDESALTLYEYMACGKPVIVPEGETDKMGVSKSVFPDDCLLRVENSPAGFAEGILCLLKNKSAAAERGELGRKRVKGIYEWKKITEKYAQALDRMVEPNPSGKKHPEEGKPL